MTESAKFLVSEAPQEAAPEAARPLSVGRQLRLARETAKWSIDDVARSLKFSARQVQALEADDFSQLQGDTFVRGFVRAYSRLFKLDAEALLGLLTVAVPPAAVRIAVPDNMGAAETRPFSEKYQRLIFVTLALIVIAVIAAYVVTRGMPEFEFLRPSAPAASEAAPVMPPPAAQATEAAASTAAGDAASSTPAPVEAVAPVVPAPAAAPSPVPVTAVEELAPGERRIALEFADRSWVEIKDASQQIILTGEFPAGTQQAVRGKPPFKLWIGRASGVRIQYGDQKVDLGRYARDDVARLTLE